jgi:hypothetical protein
MPSTLGPRVHGRDLGCGSARSVETQSYTQPEPVPTRTSRSCLLWRHGRAPARCDRLQRKRTGTGRSSTSSPRIRNQVGNLDRPGGSIPTRRSDCGEHVGPHLVVNDDVRCERVHWTRRRHHRAGGFRLSPPRSLEIRPYQRAASAAAAHDPTNRRRLHREVRHLEGDLRLHLRNVGHLVLPARQNVAAQSQQS